MAKATEPSGLKRARNSPSDFSLKLRCGADVNTVCPFPGRSFPARQHHPEVAIFQTSGVVHVQFPFINLHTSEGPSRVHASAEIAIASEGAQGNPSGISENAQAIK
jgi:hypothetical protein